MTLRLLIADDHEIVRIGVQTLLKGKPDWEICGEATNGREAIGKVWGLSPDVIILDLTMPVMNGFEAAMEIRRIAPATKIVFFSAHDVPVIAGEVGADAFVSKGATAHELMAAIERVVDFPQRPCAKGRFA